MGTGINHYGEGSKLQPVMVFVCRGKGTRGENIGKGGNKNFGEWECC